VVVVVVVVVAVAGSVVTGSAEYGVGVEEFVRDGDFDGAFGGARDDERRGGLKRSPDGEECCLEEVRITYGGELAVP
jgi:hypothetical protein